MKILSNEPIGKDLFEGKSQERIANLILADLEKARNASAGADSISGSSVIGIEGGWGCGKSNVLKILEKSLDGILNSNKKHAYSVFTYDLWGRQQDLQRKTLLQDLAAHLKSDCDVDKEERVKSLILKKTLVGADIVKKGRLMQILPILLGGLIPVLLAFAVVCPEDGSWRKLIVGCVVGIAGIAGIAGIISVCRYGKSAMAAISEFLGNMLLIKTNGAELPRVVYEHQYSVTVSDFSDLLTEIADDLLTKKKQLVIVFDNIDRLPVEKVKEFLSSAHILFAERKEKMLANIHIIIPFDRTRILATFEGQDGNDYINKTFDVVYRVAPPILKDWEKFFLERYTEAAADEPALLVQRLEVQDVFNTLSSLRNLTPRAIIAFLNSITVAHNVLGDSVPLKAIAVHELAWKPYEQKMVLDKDEASKPEASELNETRIRKGLFIPNMLLRTKYLEDENWQKWMAAIVFQVEVTRAGEILNYNLLQDALEHGKSDVVAKMSDLSSFRLLFDRALNAVRNPQNIPTAIHDVIGDNKKWCWDRVNEIRGADIAAVRILFPDLDGWHKDMLKNVSDWHSYASVLLQRNKPIKDRGATKVLFAQARNIDDVLKEVGRSLVGAFPAESVESSQYLELLNEAKERACVLGWKCDVGQFDKYVAGLVPSGSGAVGAAYVPDNMISGMTQTKQAFERISQVGDPHVTNVNSVLKVIEHLSEGRIKTALQSPYVADFVRGKHVADEDRCRAVAAAIRGGVSVVKGVPLFEFLTDAKSIQYAKQLAVFFSKYVSEETLLEKLAANAQYPVYVEATKVLLMSSKAKLDQGKVEMLLEVFGEAVQTLGIDPQVLSERMPELLKIETTKHEKCFNHQTLSQLKKCGGLVWDSAAQSVKANFDALDKKTWITKLSSPTLQWTPRAAVDVDYDWTPLALESAKDVLCMVATGKIQDDKLPSSETWSMLVSDFESKHVGVGEWFKDVKDQIIAFSGTITAKAFVFLAPWLFKYSSFGVNKDELRKLLPDATVRKSEACKKIMAENKDAVMQMFNKGDAATQDAFRAYVTAELNAHPDSPLSVFKEFLGGK